MTPELKPMERINLILQRKETDRAAYINPVSAATVDSMRATGAFFPEAHTNPDKMAALASATHDLCGLDSVAPYFSVIVEASALGCKIDFGSETAMPTVRGHIYKEPDEFAIPDDFFERPTVKCLLDSIRLLKAKYGDSAVVIGKVIGPWTLSYHLYGVQDFLADTIAEPEKVHGFLEAFRHLSLKLAVAQAVAGADMITWADHATGDLVSAAGYGEFLFPVHKKCVTELKRRLPRPTPIILHTCGNTIDRMDMFAETGFDVFHFDSKNDIDEAVRIAGGRIILAGGLNNPETMLNGTPGDVRREVEMLKGKGIRLIAPECALSTLVPNENLRAMVS